MNKSNFSESVTLANGIKTSWAPECKLASALLLLKGLYIGLVYLYVSRHNELDVGMFHRVLACWPREEGPAFASHFATWDAAHYLFLSEVGYWAGKSSCAFYPLWPLLMRAGSWLCGGSHLLSGLILANLCSVIGLTLFYRLVRISCGRSHAILALAILLAFPGSLFFQFIYSESLFFMLLMAFCLSLQAGRYDLACISGFFMPMTRAVGIFALAPLLWHLWRQRRDLHEPRNTRNTRKGTEPQISTDDHRWSEGDSAHEESPLTPALSPSYGERETRLRSWWVVIAILGGWGAYFLMMFLMTGNAFEGFAAQKNWPTNSIANLFNVPKFFIGLFHVKEFHAYQYSLLDRVFFVLLVAYLPVIYRLNKEWFLWAVVLGVFPAMISSFVSFTRYEVIAFPLFIAMAEVLRSFKHNRILILIQVGTLGGLQIWLLIRHVNFWWAG